MEKVRERPNRVHLGKLLIGHENRWVALDDVLSRVVASGDTLAKAIADAETKGHEAPIVLWAPASLTGFHL